MAKKMRRDERIEQDYATVPPCSSSTERAESKRDSEVCDDAGVVSLACSQSSSNNSQPEVVDASRQMDLEQAESSQGTTAASRDEIKSEGEESAGCVSQLNTNEPKTKRAKVIMPSQEELDEFFAAFEKESIVYYVQRYNFDFENETPLDGRYDWVKVEKHL